MWPCNGEIIQRWTISHPNKQTYSSHCKGKKMMMLFGAHVLIGVTVAFHNTCCSS